jgi:predicted nuclease of predicted toxin-antitoxin system
MRLLANENIPGDAVRLLRTRGHDVSWVREDSPGATDLANLERAVSERRVLITLDKDFGDLVFRMGREASCGVVLFRIGLRAPMPVAEKIVEVLGSREDWTGHFSVADDRQLRMVLLPGVPRAKPR